MYVIPIKENELSQNSLAYSNEHLYQMMFDINDVQKLKYMYDLTINKLTLIKKSACVQIE